MQGINRKILSGGCIGLASLLLMSSASAMYTSTVENYPFIIPGFAYPVITLSGGEAFSYDVGHSKDIYNPDTGTTATFSANHRNEDRAVFGGFIGSEMLVRPDLHIQLGLGYYQPFTFDPSGNISPGVNGYSYRLDIHQALVESKFLYNCSGRWHPYLSGALGASFNNFASYSDNLGVYEFNDHTETALTWYVGAGVDYDLLPHWRVGLNYRYTDFGVSNSQFGTAGATTLGNDLSQKHLYAHELLVQLSYMIF